MKRRPAINLSFWLIALSSTALWANPVRSDAPSGPNGLVPAQRASVRVRIIPDPLRPSLSPTLGPDTAGALKAIIVSAQYPARQAPPAEAAVPAALGSAVRLGQRVFSDQAEPAPVLQSFFDASALAPAKAEIELPSIAGPAAAEAGAHASLGAPARLDRLGAGGMAALPGTPPLLRGIAGAASAVETALGSLKAAILSPIRWLLQRLEDGLTSRELGRIERERSLARNKLRQEQLAESWALRKALAAAAQRLLDLPGVLEGRDRERVNDDIKYHILNANLDGEFDGDDDGRVDPLIRKLSVNTAAFLYGRALFFFRHDLGSGPHPDKVRRERKYLRSFAAAWPEIRADLEKNAPWVFKDWPELEPYRLKPLSPSYQEFKEQLARRDLTATETVAQLAVIGRTRYEDFLRFIERAVEARDMTRLRELGRDYFEGADGWPGYEQYRADFSQLAPLYRRSSGFATYTVPYESEWDFAGFMDRMERTIARLPKDPSDFNYAAFFMELAYWTARRGHYQGYYEIAEKAFAHYKPLLDDARRHFDAERYEAAFASARLAWEGGPGWLGLKALDELVREMEPGSRYSNESNKGYEDKRAAVVDDVLSILSHSARLMEIRGKGEPAEIKTPRKKAERKPLSGSPVKGLLLLEHHDVDIYKASLLEFGMTIEKQQGDHGDAVLVSFPLNSINKVQAELVRNKIPFSFLEVSGQEIPQEPREAEESHDQAARIEARKAEDAALAESRKRKPIRAQETVKSPPGDKQVALEFD